MGKKLGSHAVGRCDNNEGERLWAMGPWRKQSVYEDNLFGSCVNGTCKKRKNAL